MLRNLTYTLFALLTLTLLLGCGKNESDNEPSTPKIPNFAYSYVVDHAGHIYDCALNTTTGVYTSCTQSDGGVTYTQPQGLALSSIGTGVYIADAGGNLYLCTANASNAQLSGCAASNGGQSSWKPYDIAVAGISSGQIVYVVDNQGGSGNIYLCQTDAGTGALTSCSQQNGGATFAGPTQIAFGEANGAVYAYITDPSAGKLYFCLVDQNAGTLSSCAIAPGASGWAPNGVYWMTYNGSTSYTYIADSTHGDVYLCTMDTLDGDIASCAVSNGGASGWAPTAISLAYENGNFLADVSDKNGNVYVCSINTATGALSGCAVSNGGATFTQPDFVFSF